MGAIWRDVIGYEGLYQVSDQGKVRNRKRRRNLRPNTKKDGYCQVTLSKDGAVSYYMLHRLVAIAFLPNPDGLPQVNHKNGKKQDNRLVNLEWCSASENQQHRYKVLGKTETCNKSVMCTDTGEIYPSVRAAAAASGAHPSAVSMCCNGTRKSANKLHFIFMEE